MLEIIDIGASPFEGPAPYESLITAGLGRVVGFEPDPDAFRVLVDDAGHRYLPQAIGDGEEHTFHLYRAKGFNSLLELRGDLAGTFPEAKEWMEPVGLAKIQTIRLDRLSLPCDFLKMDCQGGELAALRWGRRTLRDCCLVQIEMPFLCLYKNQPTLGDLDGELHDLGFQPYNMISVHRASTGQIIDADFLYVRREPTEAQRAKTATILEMCYRAIRS